MFGADRGCAGRIDRPIDKSHFLARPDEHFGLFPAGRDFKRRFEESEWKTEKAGSPAARENPSPLIGIATVSCFGFAIERNFLIDPENANGYV
jgi:hypothetical protein